MNVVKTPTSDAPSAALLKILLAAEQEFADRGFDGAGMKALAARAEVSQSLLHYHFGSKDKLYAAVIEYRSSLINAERMQMLSACDLGAADALDQIFCALYLPALGPSGGGRAYARIFAGLIAGSARDQALVRAYYDETAKEFIAAIQSCLPHLTVPEAAQIYQSALGVLATSLARDGRVERLSGEDGAASEDNDALLTSLVRFATGGARAIGAGSDP